MLTVLGFMPMSLLAQQPEISPDDPVLAMMDSLDVLQFFKTNTFNTNKSELNIYNYPSDSIPLFSDEVYRQRMAELDQQSPFALDYNDAVKKYIEVYAVKRRGTVSRMLALSQLYFPLFEETLAKHGMPLELKYLAIVESALNPSVKSKAGAMGLWQFMYGTGKMWDMEINSYVDQRCDPVIETEAAAKYLKYLYKYYDNDWQLALAAYNAGPGNINKSIRRSGGKKDYWSLREFMPKETAGYVPAFIAVNYIMNYYKEHNIYPVEPTYYFYELDSVWVNEEVKFSTVADFLPITVDELKTLNPSFILGIIPKSSTGYALYLPKTLIGDFLANEKNIYHYQPVADTTSTQIANANPNAASPTDGKQVVEYVVESGDYLVSIARRFKVKTSDIVGWNSLTTEELMVGQKLKIYPTDESAPAVVDAGTNSTTNTSVSTKYHTIIKGDTLWSISQRYNISVDDIQKLNNISGSSIYVGQKIIVSKG